MTPASFIVRMMQPHDLAFALDLADREGWNPGKDDAVSFHAADPAGFLIGELAGEPIGCISAVSYAGRFGFIGLYIIRPEYRGRGYGLTLWNAAMQRLVGHTIGLDGVVAQQDNYRRSGFRLAYRNIRYQGVAVATAVDSRIVPARDVPFLAIRELDRRIFPEHRDDFLRHWLTQPTVGALVAQDEGRPVGFTVVRSGRAGWRIGPLMAPSRAVAATLLDAASAHVPVGEPIMIDVPQVNTEAIALVRDRGLTPIFETARMYIGPDPAIDLTQLFGVTTLELG
jgi:ribosomal protein S18 acetylase RimI-like enzyme